MPKFIIYIQKIKQITQKIAFMQIFIIKTYSIIVSTRFASCVSTFVLRFDNFLNLNRRNRKTQNEKRKLKVERLIWAVEAQNAKNLSTCDSFCVLRLVFDLGPVHKNKSWGKLFVKNNNTCHVAKMEYFRQNGVFSRQNGVFSYN